MAFWLKKKYKLPYEIMLKINDINHKEFIEDIKINKRIFHTELMYYIEDLETYKMHEFYFIQFLTFLRNNEISHPKFNNQLEFYDINIRDELINNFHYLLYKDHVNIRVYQNKEYNIYYNLMI